MTDFHNVSVPAFGTVTYENLGHRILVRERPPFWVGRVVEKAVLA